MTAPGELAVEYKYDAWGCLLSTTGRLAETLGKQNPFRWRCNLYDDKASCIISENGIIQQPSLVSSIEMMQSWMFQLGFYHLILTPTAKTIP